METATAVEIHKGRLRQLLLDDSHKLFGKAFAKTGSGFTTVPTAPAAIHSLSEEAITNKPRNTKFKLLPDKLFGRDGHHTLNVSVSVVPPTERDVVAVEGEQSMVGDGDAMGITTEVTQHLFRTAEGRFSVDDPFMPM